MAVKVSFHKPAFLGRDGGAAIGECRISETVTVPGTTTASAQDREWIVMVSTETATAVAAHGTTPDAAATAATAATTAGYGLPAGMHVVVAVKTGDKVNIKAFV